MRTWSVSGTAFALCTRSSSLSMSTKTSIGSSVLTRSDRSILRGDTAQRLGDRRGDERVHAAPEHRDLLDSAGGDEAVLRARHHVDGLDPRVERSVEVVHLELPLEVRDDAEALDDRAGAAALRELDDEFGEE